VPWDFVNAKSGVTVTLPATPPRNAVVVVRNGDGSLIKLSSVKDFNGSKTGELRREGTSIEFHYFIDSDEWFAR
jgi:hypothetical protein